MSAGVLLLAGGFSRRFGGDKRLSRLADGRSLLEASIDNVLRAKLPLLVCLRAEDTELAAELESKNIPCKKCPNSELGMGSTLADGMSAVPSSWSGVIISLGDMPRITSDSYARVGDALDSEEIVVPVHGGRRGHPVGFARQFFPDLEQLSGDQGAKQVLRENSEAVTVLDLNDPGILLDVDLPEQLASIGA